MSGVLWKCDECGGPAVWTLIDEVVYYHCERQCDGFMQSEMFDLEGVDRPVILDRSGSVSALDEDEGASVWVPEILDEQHRRFLNGS